MRLTGILILTAVLQVSATGRAQTVTYSAQSAPLIQALSVIEKQTGYHLFYDDADLAGSKPVTVQLKEVPLREALEAVLASQSLVFDIHGHTIVITRPQTPVLQAGDTTRKGTTIRVRGTVFNEAGEPLSGANVIIKEIQKGTITNARGEFDLGAVQVNSTLIFSFIGYAPQQMKVKDIANLKIYLNVAKSELDKVVIQAYGTTTQRYQTGDIATVTAEEIEKHPVINPLLALQGQVAGLDVSQTSGYASAPVKVELRGRSSLGDFPSDPLYIVDGVPLTVNEIGGGSSYGNGSSGFIQNGHFAGPASGQSPLFSINSNDIETITVLKDADATAIYGSRGANGVILITTKKGKAGKIKFDLKVEQGATRLMHFWQMLNTQQYLAVRREALKNDGLTPNASNAYDLLIWDTTKSTDWQRALLNRTGLSTDVQASLSGGDAHTVFRIGAGYKRETSIITVGGADQQGSLSFDLTHKSVDDRLKVDLKTFYVVTQSNIVSLPANITLPPDAPGIYDSAGNLNFAGWNPIRGNYPYSALKNSYTGKTNFLNSSLAVSFEPMRGLVIRSSFGYNNAQANQTYFFPIAAQDPANHPTGGAQFGNNNNKNWIIEPQLTYDALLWKGKLSVLAGTSYQNNTTEGLYLIGVGYTSDALLRTISNAPTKSGSDNYGEYKYAAVYGRVNYILQGKYILNLSARRDGSSNFGPGNQFGNFGALGAAWIFSEEGWFKKHIPLLSFGKLKGSYGTTGSDHTIPYSYLTRWSSDGLVPYENIQPLVPTQHANPNYQWEVNKKLETSIELGFLKDHISLTATYYRNRCGNQLILFPLPNFTGFGQVVGNLPALVQNAGEEFLLSVKIVDNAKLTWSVNGNIAFNQNKLVAFPNLAQSPFYASSYIVGQPLNLVRVLHYTGVDPLTGQYTFEDKNHDGVITPYVSPADDLFIKYLAPKYFGGFGTKLAYKGAELSVFFSFKNQIGKNAIAQGDFPGSSYSNQPVAILGKEWRKPGDIATVARFTTQPAAGDIYFHQSDAGYTDASYIRLKNLSISYSLPASYIRNTGMKACHIFIRGENLLVFTRYQGLDPEVQAFGVLPQPAIFTGGLSCNF